MSARTHACGRLLCLACLLPALLLAAWSREDPLPGSLLLENRLPEAVTLTLDGTEQGEVAAGDQLLVPGLPAGSVVAVARTASGRQLSQRFEIFPAATCTWQLDAGRGQVLVRNHVGEPVDLFVDKVRVRRMERLSSAMLSLDPGRHVVAGFCPATQHTESHEVDVEGGRQLEVPLGPQGGRLVLDNRTDMTLSVFRNGAPLATVKPGVTVELSGQPLGRSLVEAVNEQGRVIVRTQVDVAAASGPRARLSVGDAFVLVTVVNGTGEPVKIDPDAVAEVRTIPKDGRAEVRLLGEVRVIRLVGADTGTRYDQPLQALPGQSVTVELKPTAGGIVFDNKTQGPLVVRLDGREVGEVAAGARRIVSPVAPGRHKLEADSGGQSFETTACELVRDGWFTWDISGRSGTLRVVNNSGEDVLVSVNGEPAGRLANGMQTELKKLGAVPVSVATVGADSRRKQVFSITPVPGQTAVFAVAPASGGIRLTGLAGREARVTVDGSTTTVVPAGAAEPVTLPLVPGEHSVDVDLADGVEVSALVDVSPDVYGDLPLSDTAPGITVRNRAGEPLLVWVRGRVLAKVEDGSDVALVLPSEGVETVCAATEDARREWVLPDIYFRASGRFGWTLEK